MFVWNRHPISNKLVLSPSIVEMLCLEALAWVLVGGFVSFFQLKKLLLSYHVNNSSANRPEYHSLAASLALI